MFFFILKILRPPISTLFPYTTLFRSQVIASADLVADLEIRFVDWIVRYPLFQWERHAVDASRKRRQTLLVGIARDQDRKSTRLNSSHSQISYAVFCLKKKIYIDAYKS